MVKTVEEIAREQDVVLQRKAGKPCNSLVRRYRPNIRLRVSGYTTEWSVQWQIFGLSLSVNSGPSMSAKKR